VQKKRSPSRTPKARPPKSESPPVLQLPSLHERLPMKVEQAKSPSLAEFKHLVRHEFSFLSPLGFREASPPNKRYQNPYEVHFEKDGWRLVVGGFSYGFSADIDVRAPDGRVASLGHFVPQGFWRTHRDSFARGQQGDIAYQEAWQLQERERMMERGIQKADAAFRAARYAEAAVELAPFEQMLPPAQVKKLAIARKRKNGHPSP
jgi:hypothetical protein